MVTVLLFLGFSEAAVFELNGTVYDINGNPLNNTNISIALKDNTWSDLGTNFTTTNSSGWFGVNVTSNSSYFYLLSIFHVNATFNHIDWVGQSLPSFPYQEFVLLGGNLKFYLDEGIKNFRLIERYIIAYNGFFYFYFLIFSELTKNLKDDDDITHIIVPLDFDNSNKYKNDIH